MYFSIFDCSRCVLLMNVFRPCPWDLFAIDERWHVAYWTTGLLYLSVGSLKLNKGLLIKVRRAEDGCFVLWFTLIKFGRLLDEKYWYCLRSLQLTLTVICIRNSQLSFVGDKGCIEAQLTDNNWGVYSWPWQLFALGIADCLCLWRRIIKAQLTDNDWGVYSWPWQLFALGIANCPLLVAKDYSGTIDR